MSVTIPNEGGRLIEIENDNTITDHGQVWRSATKIDTAYSDLEGAYDGFGLFNAPISNIVIDDRGNLHFVAGHGSPYQIDENLPFSSNREPVPSLSNFQWLMWGKDLATKIASFPTGGARVWGFDSAGSTDYKLGDRLRTRSAQSRCDSGSA